MSASERLDFLLDSQLDVAALEKAGSKSYETVEVEAAAWRAGRGDLLSAPEAFDLLCEGKRDVLVSWIDHGGLDVETTDGCGTTLLGAACVLGDESGARMLLERGADPEARSAEFPMAPTPAEIMRKTGMEGLLHSLSAALPQQQKPRALQIRR